jgi:uncharacterized membrane protein YdjX (TVP38/TMEM64 family)
MKNAGKLPGVERYPQMILKIFLMLGVIFGLRYAFLRGYINEVGIQHFVSRAGVMAGPLFILVVAVGIMALGPPLLLIGSGTVAFGSLLGAIYSFMGIMVGACAAFLLGRSVMINFARNRRPKRFPRINRWMEKNGLAFIVGLRLMLFANPPLNYTASLTRMTFRDYVIGSFIGLLPGVFVFAYAFDEFTHARRLSFMDVFVNPAFATMWLLRLSGVVLLIVLAWWYKEERLPEQSYTPGD